MSRRTPTIERTRVYSVVGVFLVAGGILAFLFHEPATVTFDVEGPSEITLGGNADYTVTITVPAGQRLPVEGATVVIEDAQEDPPVFLSSATCWGETACDTTLRHTGRGSEAVARIGRGPDDAAPSLGRLWVRVQGFGSSPATGYGREVLPERSLGATDLVDESGRAGYGLGYGDDEAPTILRYAVTLDPSALEPGRYHMTFLVETGSLDMGSISAPRVGVRLT